MRYALSFATALMALAFMIAPGASLADDRDPTPEETASVTEALKAQGCTSFDDIDVEKNGAFDIDDAVCSDGKKYDFTLDAQFGVLSKTEDKD